MTVRLVCIYANDDNNDNNNRDDDDDDDTTQANKSIVHFNA